MRKQLLGAVTAALLGGAIYDAHAVPTLGFQLDGGAVITCADQSSCDLDPTIGSVTYVDGADSTKDLPLFTVSVTTGTSKPALPGNVLMDLNSIDIRTTEGGSHTLLIMFSDSAFDASGYFTGAFGGTLDGAAGSSIMAQAYYDTSDALFALTTLIGAIGPFGPTGAFAGQFSDGASPAAPYSLTQVLTLTTTGAAAFSGDFAIRVPEPTTLALLGIGLLGFGWGRRQAV